MIASSPRPTRRVRAARPSRRRCRRCRDLASAHARPTHRDDDGNRCASSAADSYRCVSVPHPSSFVRCSTSLVPIFLMTSGWADTNRPVSGDVAQKLVERGSVCAVLDRVHPHEHPVETEELIPHLVHGVIGVDDGLCFDAHLIERLEGIGQTPVRARPRGGRAVSPKEQTNPSRRPGHCVILNAWRYWSVPFTASVGPDDRAPQGFGTFITGSSRLRVCRRAVGGAGRGGFGTREGIVAGRSRSRPGTP